MKKFYAVIGNPPYNEDSDTYNRQPPIYPMFYDGAKEISEKYELITPARFLFNAGLTSKEWNEKMLNDKHIKVLKYFQNSSDVFQNTSIIGGVAIVLGDNNKSFEPIGQFIPDDTLRKIATHFTKDESNNLPSIIYGGRSDLKFNDVFLKDYPESIEIRLKAVQAKHKKVSKLGPNEEYELKSSTLEVLSYVFDEQEPQNKEDYYKLFGVIAGNRAYRWIRKKYMTYRYPEHNNINSFKVFIPESNGAGLTNGDIIGLPVVAGPGESCTPSFISAGCFDTEEEALSLSKYLKTRFVRGLLLLLKVTQHNPKSVWAYVPVQDFTSTSDIDWSKPISDIDDMLYKKYKLDSKEIEFIESHVKEMT